MNDNIIVSINKLLSKDNVKWEKTIYGFKGVYGGSKLINYIKYRLSEGIFGPGILATLFFFFSVNGLAFVATQGVFDIGVFIIANTFYIVMIDSWIHNLSNMPAGLIFGPVERYINFKRPSIRIALENSENLSINGKPILTLIWLNSMSLSVNGNDNFLKDLLAFDLYEEVDSIEVYRDDYKMFSLISMENTNDKETMDLVVHLTSRLGKLISIKDEYINNRLISLDNILSDTIVKLESEDYYKLSNSDKETYDNLVSEIVQFIDDKVLDLEESWDVNNFKSSDLSIELEYVKNLRKNY